jgi:hypothetical protein
LRITFNGGLRFCTLLPKADWSESSRVSGAKSVASSGPSQHDGQRRVCQ